MKYRAEDGTIVDTDNAKRSYDEGRDWNGSNHIGRSSNSQWHYQTLRQSRKGRWYIEHTSCVQGGKSYVEFITEKEAAAWLLLNDFSLPECLESFGVEVSE